MRVVWSSLALGCVLVSCDHSRAVAPPPAQSFDCTAVSVAGIVLTTVDSVSDTPVLTTATVTVQDGAHTEPGLAAPPSYYAAYERPGTYLVTATVTGYRQWQAANVVVRSDQCHVQTVRLTARLVR